MRAESEHVISDTITSWNTRRPAIVPVGWTANLGETNEVAGWYSGSPYYTNLTMTTPIGSFVTSEDSYLCTAKSSITGLSFWLGRV